MAKHESAKGIALAHVLRTRLESVLPPDFQLAVRGDRLDVAYNGVSDRRIHLNLWNEYDTDQENISLIVLSALNNLQDAIVDTTREIWPAGQETTELPLPDTSWNDQALNIWFGDEQNPTLRLEPVYLSEVVPDRPAQI